MSAKIKQLWFTMDSPIEQSLCTVHAHLAIKNGRTYKYPDDVTPFAAVPHNPIAHDWCDLAQITPIGSYIVVEHCNEHFSADKWRLSGRSPCIALLGDQVEGVYISDRIQPLDYSDLPSIYKLFSRARPGIFCDRTLELGTFYGIFDHNRLIAIGGQRMHPDPFIEISGISTDPDYRKMGLASTILRYLVANITGRGYIPYLNVSAANTIAISVYEKLGFRLPKRQEFFTLKRI